jgi:hypothetical protein
MEILVKPPYKKWERNNIGQRDQFMTLDCTVRDVKPDGTVLLAFEDDYISGLEIEKAEIFEQVLNDYMVQTEGFAGGRATQSPLAAQAALDQIPFVINKGVAAKASAAAPNDGDVIAPNALAAFAGGGELPITFEQVARVGRGEWYLNPAISAESFATEQRRMRQEWESVYLPTGFTDRPGKLALSGAGAVQVSEPPLPLFFGYIEGCDCSFCSLFRKEKELELPRPHLTESELDALPQSAQEELRDLRLEVRGLRMQRYMERQLFDKMEAEAKREIEALFERFRARLS